MEFISWPARAYGPSYRLALQWKQQYTWCLRVQKANHETELKWCGEVLDEPIIQQHLVKVNIHIWILKCSKVDFTQVWPVEWLEVLRSSIVFEALQKQNKSSCMWQKVCFSKRKDVILTNVHSIRLPKHGKRAQDRVYNVWIASFNSIQKWKITGNG